jgi:hypothetical protein
VDHTPNGPQQGTTLRDRLATCLWWLLFMGSVAAGTAIGIMLTLWLLLPPLTGLLLIGACWLCGNVAGWRLAGRCGADGARKKQGKARSIDAWQGAIDAQSDRFRAAKPHRAVALRSSPVG